MTGAAAAESVLWGVSASVIQGGKELPVPLHTARKIALGMARALSGLPAALAIWDGQAGRARKRAVLVTAPETVCAFKVYANVLKPLLGPTVASSRARGAARVTANATRMFSDASARPGSPESTAPFQSVHRPVPATATVSTMETACATVTGPDLTVLSPVALLTVLATARASSTMQQRRVNRFKLAVFAKRISLARRAPSLRARMTVADEGRASTGPAFVTRAGPAHRAHCYHASRYVVTSPFRKTSLRCDHILRSI